MQLVECSRYAQGTPEVPAINIETREANILESIEQQSRKLSKTVTIAHQYDEP